MDWLARQALDPAELDGESPGGRPAPGRVSLTSRIPPSRTTRAAMAGSAGAALPEPVRVQMEDAFDFDFGRVRVHEDDLAVSVGAVAVARGEEVHFAPGQYDPGSASGQELLGHELAHVVQQAEGRVTATVQGKSGSLNDDEQLEREADEWGAQAARGEAISRQGGAGGGAENVVQRRAAGVGAAGAAVALVQEYAGPVGKVVLRLVPKAPPGPGAAVAAGPAIVIAAGVIAAVALDALFRYANAELDRLDALQGAAIESTGRMRIQRIKEERRQQFEIELANLLAAGEITQDEYNDARMTGLRPVLRRGGKVRQKAGRAGGRPPPRPESARPMLFAALEASVRDVPGVAQENLQLVLDASLAEELGLAWGWETQLVLTLEHGHLSDLGVSFSASEDHEAAAAEAAEPAPHTDGSGKPGEEKALFREYEDLASAVLRYSELQRRTMEFNRRIREFYGLARKDFIADGLLLDAEHFVDARFCSIYAAELAALGILSPADMPTFAVHYEYHRRSPASLSAQAGLPEAQALSGASLTQEKLTAIPHADARQRYPTLTSLLEAFIVFWMGKPGYWERVAPALLDLWTRARDGNL